MPTLYWNALERAQRAFSIETEDTFAEQLVIDIDSEAGTAEVPAELLSAVARRRPDKHVWSKISLREIPDYVGDALRACAPASPKLVITHGERSSHPSGTELPVAKVLVLPNLRNASRGHPGRLPFSNRRLSAVGSHAAAYA